LESNINSNHFLEVLIAVVKKGKRFEGLNKKAGKTK